MKKLLSSQVMKLMRLLRRLSVPVVSEWVFFVIFFLAMGKLLVRAVLYIPFDGSPEVSWLFALGQVFIIDYIVTLIIYLARRRWVKCVAYLLVLGAFLVREFLKNVFVMDISPSVLMLVAETSPRETSEFFGEYMLTSGALMSVGVTVVVGLVALFLERYRHRWAERFSQSKKRTNGLALINAILLVWGVVAGIHFGSILKCKTLDELSLWDIEHSQYADAFSLTASSAYGLHLASGDMNEYILTTIRAAREQKAEDGDEVNIIVVVGESHIKWHSSLYGYPLPTCPYQQAEADSSRLFVFGEALTSSNFTTTAMKNMLCCNSTAEGESWNGKPFFPSIMKSSGFDVYMWDNQREASTSATYTFALNSFLYNDTIQQLSYTATNRQCFAYDGELIDDFARQVKRKSKRNLVVFHLLGQHFEARERFPHDTFSKFTPQDIPNNASYLNDEKRQEIADYDNATLYNDYVMKKVFDLYRDEPTVVIYLSDHGEEIYDYRDTKGRVSADDGADDVYNRFQHQIPFTIWCSDSYKKSRPDMAEAIAKSVEKPWLADNLCHLVFRLGGVETPFYKANRDVLDSSYSADVPDDAGRLGAENFIAHAGGMIDSVTYTNSREALENSIAEGYKYIELDLSLTKDSVLVCSHDFDEFPEGHVPTSDEFLASRYAGRFTPMKLAEAIDIWRNSDCIFVTDKISDPMLLNKYFRPDERSRVYVETPYKENYRALKENGYIPMFCLYDLGAPNFLYYMKLRLVDRLKIDRIVVHTGSNPKYLRYIRKHHRAKVAMYTSNSHYFFLQHIGYDADMIYTDNWNIKNNSNYNKSDTSTY